MTSAKLRAQLPLELIAALASRPNVRRVAVVNALNSLPMSLSYADAIGNLELDAALYQWNSATVLAIRAGIDIAYSR